MGAKGNDKQSKRPEKLTFDEFPPHAYKDWLQTAKKSLKGLPYDNLFSETYEQITLKPIYRSEDIEGISQNDQALRNVQRANSGWEVCQPISSGDPEAFALAAKDSLQNGQKTLHVQLDRSSKLGCDSDETSPRGAQDGLRLSGLRDLEQALSTIHWERAPFYIESGLLSFPIVCLFAALANKQNKDLSTLRGCIGADPYAMWVSEGRLPLSLSQTFQWMANTIRWTRTNAPHLQTICAQSTPYHQGGANATQELAFTLATVADYIRELLKRSLTIDEIAPQIRFSFSTHPTFFIEVAKLRAARLLWSKIIEAFGGSSTSQKMFIHARAAERTKTLLDPHTNILRATTEAFAAIVGGADSLQVSPYTNESTDRSYALATRIARNTQHILNEEAYLSKVSDPAGGAWYIESLTDSIAERAWTLFQQIEKMGGMKKALIQQFPQQEIKKVAEKRKRNAETRTDEWIGSNVYANLAESIRLPRKQEFAADRAKSTSEADSFVVIKGLKRRIQRHSKDPFLPITDALRHGLALSDCYRLVADGQREPSIQPIKARRETEPFESLRFAAARYKEQTGKRPQVYLLCFGAATERSLSLDFVQHFFSAGGFETIISENFSTIDLAASAGIASNYETIALCGPMNEQQIREIAEKIRKQKPNIDLLLAGRPRSEQIKPFRQAGIHDYIHDQTNCFELLRKLQRKKGIQS